MELGPPSDRSPAGVNIYPIVYWTTYAFAMISVVIVVLSLLWYLNARKKFSSPIAKKKISAVGLVTIFTVILAIIQLLMSVYRLELLYNFSFSILIISSVIHGSRLIGRIIVSFSYRTKQKKTTYNPLVTLILPAYNEAKVIEKTINSLLRLSYKNKEIIVVDDGSTDDTLKIAEDIARNAPITVISKPNGGKWSALNTGVEKANGEILICIDADTLLDKNAIEPLIPYFEDKKVAAVAGNIKVGNRKTGLTKLQALEYVLGLNIQRRNESIIGKLSVVPGPLGAFRKSVVEEVGKYSRDTFAEDADLTLSILRAGYKIKYEKRAIGYTEAPSTLLDLGKQRYRWYRGQLQVMKKHKKAIFKVPWVFFDGILLSWFSFFSLLWLFILMFNPYAAFNVFQPEALPPAHAQPPPHARVNEKVFQSIPLLYIFLFLVIEGIELFIALYATMIDVKEKPRLALNILFYKLLYMKLLDTIRIFSQIEEFLKYPMKWEIAERTGKFDNRT